MIHSGGHRRHRGSKGSYERGGDGEGDGSACAHRRNDVNQAKSRMEAAATEAKVGCTLSSACRRNDVDQAAKGCMDAAAKDAKAGSTLNSGCCAAKAPAWMEEFFGDSTLCKKKWNMQEVVKEVRVKQNAPAPSSCLLKSSLTINPLKETDMILLEGGFCNCEKDSWNLELKANQREKIHTKGCASACLGYGTGEELPQKKIQEPPLHQLLQQKQHQQCQQQAAHTPKSMVQKPEWNTEEEVKEVHVKQNVPAPSSYLLKSSGLQSLFVKACGVSVSVQVDVFNTKVDFLVNSACQKIGVNAQDTYAVLCGKVLEYDKLLSEYPLHRNSTIEIRYRGRAGQPMTFDQKFNVNAGFLYHNVHLHPDLQNVSIQGVPYAQFFSDFASYNIQKVLMHVTGLHREGWSYNGAFTSQNIIFHEGAVNIVNVPTVPFHANSCARDYGSLYNIFSTRFGPNYPLHFEHLLEFLRTCPYGVNSRGEAIIAFVTNHPSIESYVDRMKQLMILDNVLHRHPTHHSANVRALGTYVWRGQAILVPELSNILNYKPPGFPQGWHNLLYTDDARGCLHFANNFLKHARNRFLEEQMEASFSLNVKDYLPSILQGLAELADRTQNRQYIFDMLSNPLADVSTGN